MSSPFLLPLLSARSQDAAPIGSLGVFAGDICDAEALRAAVPEGVDCVFHVAGDTRLEDHQAAFQAAQLAPFAVRVTGWVRMCDRDLLHPY